MTLTANANRLMESVRSGELLLNDQSYFILIDNYSYMDLEGGDEEHHELVWCKAACGNNMHKECFEQWAKSQAGQTVKCVYCRTPWQVDAGDISELMKVGSVGADGYVNVADQLGMTGQRDYSTYHPCKDP
jgi:hypothetical protein